MRTCDFTRFLSIRIHEFLTDVFKYNLGFSELGMTDHIMYEFAKYSKSSGTNDIEIFKTNWKIESIYGNDLDLFVEQKNGKYLWFALQAKIMSPNSAFKDLKSNPISLIHQWDKLLSHESTFGSKSYYLLYSGYPRKNKISSLPIRTDCIGIPNREEYGLSIVETTEVKTIRNTIINTYQQFFYKYVYPKKTDSFRKLICCPVKTSGMKEYERADIDTSNYYKIDTSGEIENDDKLDEQDTKGKNVNAKYRMIIKTNR